MEGEANVLSLEALAWHVHAAKSLEVDDGAEGDGRP